MKKVGSTCSNRPSLGSPIVTQQWQCDPWIWWISRNPFLTLMGFETCMFPDLENQIQHDWVCLFCWQPVNIYIYHYIYIYLEDLIYHVTACVFIYWFRWYQLQEPRSFYICLQEQCGGLPADGRGYTSKGGRMRQTSGAKSWQQVVESSMESTSGSPVIFFRTKKELQTKIQS